MKSTFLSFVDSIESGQLFSSLMFYVAILAAVTHLAFATLFYTNAVPLLATVNVVSVVYYLVVAWMIRVHVHQVIIWVLVVGELLGHAVLAVYLIGWESGFHFYIMLIPPVMMISPVKSVQIKALMVTMMMTLYILMDYILRSATSVFDLSLSVLNALHYFNLLSVLLLMVSLSGLYYRLVTSNQKKLKEMATTDPLTGLHNRRSLQQIAFREIEDHKRSGIGLSLLLCDLDKFKQVNDEYGHQAGDQVLKGFSSLVSQAIRVGDFAARWGGEEFLLLLPSTVADDAMVVAERIRKEFEMTPMVDGFSELKVTVTIGISEFNPEDTFDQFLARADEALYKGKALGRNQVVVSSAPEQKAVSDG